MAGPGTSSSLSSAWSTLADLETPPTPRLGDSTFSSERYFCSSRMPASPERSAVVSLYGGHGLVSARYVLNAALSQRWTVEGARARVLAAWDGENGTQVRLRRHVRAIRRQWVAVTLQEGMQQCLLCRRSLKRVRREQCADKRREVGVGRAVAFAESLEGGGRRFHPAEPSVVFAHERLRRRDAHVATSA